LTVAECQDSAEKDQVSAYVDSDFITRVSIAHDNKAAANKMLLCINDDDDFVETFSQEIGGDYIVYMHSAPEIVEVLHIPPSPPSSSDPPSQTEIVLGPTNVKTGDDNGGGMSTGALVGIIIGCIVAGMLLMAAAVYVYVLVLRKQKAHQVMLKASSNSRETTTTSREPLRATGDEPTSSSVAGNQHRC